MNIQNESNKKSLDFDLNLVPIIDCFTVLVTFLLVSTAFISVGILDAGIAGPITQATPDPSEVPPIQISVEVLDSKSLQIKVEGKEKSFVRAQDIAAMTQNLQNIKKRWPKTDILILSAQDGVPYKDLIFVMEEIRKTIPNVVLGGF